MPNTSTTADPGDGDHATEPDSAATDRQRPTTGAAGTSTSAKSTGHGRTRINGQLLVASAVLAVGLFLIVRGVSLSVTGDDRARYPSAIEEVSPVPEAVQAFALDSVVVDLAAGYTGELTIDDVTIDTVAIGEYVDPDIQAGEQIALPPVTIYEPGNATLTFTPSASAPIQRFDVGEHTVRVAYWKVVDGRQRSRSYVWTFNVA